MTVTWRPCEVMAEISDFGAEYAENVKSAADAAQQNIFRVMVSTI